MAETDQSAGAGERRYFPAVLGWTVLGASTVTLIQFLLSLNYLKFWTFHWGISIFFIIGLFAAGVAMLHLSSLGRLRLTEILFGVFYSILAVLIYVFMGYFQSFHHLAPAEFFGYATLLVISGGMGVFCLYQANHRFVRIPSYGFGVGGVFFIFAMIVKYVFSGAPFQPGTFMGEIVVLIVGAVLFIKLYGFSDG